MGYYLHCDGSQLDDPANEDSQLEEKLQNNLKEASGYVVKVCGDVKEKQVDEESESEWSSDVEGSYCVDNMSGREDGEDIEEDDYSNDSMSELEEEDVEYGSPRKVIMTKCVTPRKDKSMAEGKTDTLTPIDDLLKSSDDEEEIENVDDLKVDSSKDEDSQLEQKLKNNLYKASRYDEKVCDGVEEKQVDEETESEWSSDAEVSYCVDNMSDREDEDMEEDDYSNDSMTEEEDEDVQYESPRKAIMTECMTPRKDDSMAEGKTDTLETLTPIDDLIKSSDDEEESENLDSDKIVSSNLKVDSSMEQNDDNEGESEVQKIISVKLWINPKSMIAIWMRLLY